MAAEETFVCALYSIADLAGVVVLLGFSKQTNLIFPIRILPFPLISCSDHKAVKSRAAALEYCVWDRQKISYALAHAPFQGHYHLNSNQILK